MRGINIPPFARRIEIGDLDHFLATRLNSSAVIWPDQAIPLLCYMCYPNDQSARNDL